MTPQEITRRLQAALELHRNGRLAEALVIYQRIRAIAPKNFDAAHLAGTAELQQGRAAQAAVILAHARRLDPKSAVCAMRLGVALTALGQFSEAETELRATLEMDPALPEGWFHLGRTLERSGRAEEAIAAFERAVSLNPNYAEALEHQGTLLTSVRGHAAAEPCFRRAVELDPRFARAWCNLGICLVYLGRLGEALAAFDRSLEIDPQLHHAHAGRGLALERCYRLPEAVESYGRAVTADPHNHQARSARLVALHYLGGISRESLFHEHVLYGQSVAAPVSVAADLSRRGPVEEDRRLRLGFLSPNLRRHSVAYFLDPLLEHLDPAQFEIFLYHDHATMDAMSERLRSHAAHWRPVAGRTHAALEAAIRDDRIDILIDLAGHTDLNRLPVFARRVAPVQATYLGYPNTTGLAEMDYRLVDAISDPPGESDALCTEKLIRFSSTAWCYVPPESSAGLRPAPDRPVTFGCFNNFAKITDETFQVWARLLAAVPNSRLLLKGFGLGEPTLQAAACGRMVVAGIAPERIDLLERMKSQDDHLAAYARMDVALDTFPYHGTTTTCEALWMGVPVITLSGDRHASRVGSSLLQAIGHPEWIAANWDDYIRKAAALAADPVRRLALRQGLREEMRRSPLLDHAGQAARFGAALREMWRAQCARAAAGAERKVA